MNQNEKQTAQKIRTQYLAKEENELDILQKLDSKVKRPANVFSYVFGSIGALVMGSGMSLIMTDIATKIGLESDLAMFLGIGIGTVGLIITLINYPIYKGILKSRKKKYASRIIALSEQIMKK